MPDFPFLRAALNALKLCLPFALFFWFAYSVATLNFPGIVASIGTGVALLIAFRAKD